MNLTHGLISYWKLDGNSVDSFGGHNGTDTNVTYVTGKIKDGAEFVGVAEISVGNILPSNSGSINFWIYHNDSVNQSYPIWDSNGGFFTIIGNTINQYIVAYYSPTSLSFIMPKVDNVWQMITVTWDGSVVNGYVNGTLQNSLGMSGSLVGFGDMLLGRTTVTANFKLDEVGVWNRVLTQQEILALYNNEIGFQYPFGKILAPNSNLASGLTAYYKLDGNSSDSLNLNNGVDTSVTWANGKINGSARFNGSAKIEISNAAASPFRQNEAITYSVWVNMVAGSQIVMGTATASGQGSGGINIAPGYSYFTWTPTTPASDRSWYAVTTIPDNTWTHIAFTILFSGASVGKFYVNGSPISTTLDLSAPTDGTPQTAYNVTNGDCIGARYVNGFIPTFGGGYSNGLIDEVGLWNRVLSSTEILNLYNVGKGFSFPFRRVISQNNTNLANALIGYFNLNGNADDLIGNFSSTDGSPVYTVGKINLGRNFNGVVGDNIIATQTLNNYTKFSMSIWFNADDLSGYKCVIGSSPFEVFLGGTQIQILWNSGGLVNKFWNFSHGVNEWHNLIIVFDGTLANDDRIKVYGDGVLAVEASFPTIPSIFNIDTIYLATSIFGYYYDGILDEFAVWGRDLTNEEIAYIYNSGVGKAYPFFTNLLKY